MDTAYVSGSADVQQEVWSAWWPATSLGGTLWGIALALATLRGLLNLTAEQSAGVALVEFLSVPIANYLVMVFVRWIALVIPHNTALATAEATRLRYASASSGLSGSFQSRAAAGFVQDGREGYTGGAFQISAKYQGLLDSIAAETEQREWDKVQASPIPNGGVAQTVDSETKIASVLAEMAEAELVRRTHGASPQASVAKERSAPLGNGESGLGHPDASEPPTSSDKSERTAGGGPRLADELALLASLHRQGSLSDAEFARAKSKLLS